MRGGAEVARWAHNPKVIGSSPIPATKEEKVVSNGHLFLFLKKMVYRFDPDSYRDISATKEERSTHSRPFLFSGI